VWEFLNAILTHAGPTAALYTLTLFGMAFGVRALWTRNQKLHETVASVQETEAKKRSDMRDAHEKQIGALMESRRLEVERLISKIDTLQEARVQSATEVTREVVEHVAATRQAVERTGDTLDFLRDVITARK